MDATILILLSTVMVTVMLLSSIFILALRGTKRPTIFMSACRLLSAVLVLVNTFQTIGTPAYGHVLWNPMHILTMLLCYPLLFAYMFSLMRPQSIGRSYWIICYAPVILLAAIHGAICLMRGPLPLMTDYGQIGFYLDDPRMRLRFIGMLLFLTEMTLFAVLSWRMQREHMRNLKSEFSFTEGGTLVWVRWNIVLNLMKGILAVMLIAMEGRWGKGVNGMFYIIESILTTIWVLRQEDLYRQPEKGVRSVAEAQGECPHKERRLREQLLTLLEHEEIFTDPELSSEKVRALLHTNRTYLSRVINQELGTNFYNLINDYRLKKAAVMMKAPMHRSTPLKDIAGICGFKSLAAFSTFFRNTYGKTPTEWRDENSAGKQPSPHGDTRLKEIGILR